MFSQEQYLPHFHTCWQIEFQKVYCGATSGCASNDFSTEDAKMPAPDLGAWIEKRDNLTTYRINRSDIGTFETIAIITGASKIFSRTAPTMFFCNDVIRFVREKGVRFS